MVKQIDDTLSAHGSMAQDIANAPGTLPRAQVEARFLALECHFRHDNTISPPAPSEEDAVEVTATAGIGVPLRNATLFYTTDGGEPSPASARIPMEVATDRWDERIGYISTWKAAIPAQPNGTVVRYRIGGRLISDGGGDEPTLWAHDGQGFWFRFPGERGITTFAYLVEAPRRPLPSWMDDAVIYHIFLDRFHPGTPDSAFGGNSDPRGRHGGTLRGVIESLPYIADLGANCIWLSPLHPAETYHRYDTKDYFDVDPDLGTREDFRALVDAAHMGGIRVLLDFVPSHCSWHHPAFEAAQRDRSAPTASWFTFDDWPQSYRSFMQATRYLPSFNLDDPGAREHLIESAVYWIREFGVDGYRMDHAIAPSMDFWVALRTAIERARPDVVNLGEATDTPDSLRRYRGKLHGILDFELAAALRLTFGAGRWGVGRLDSMLSSYERYMVDGPGRASFLDNHDMDRFLWLAGNDVDSLKLAALCQFTLAPTPIVYYGTEIGMSQQHGKDAVGFGGDAEARRDMPWDSALWNGDLLEFYRALIRMRREHPVLSTGARSTLHVDDAAGTWTYVRSGESGNTLSPGDIVVTFNLSAEERPVDLPPAARLEMLISTAGARQTEDTATLPARSGAAFIVRSLD